MWGRLAGPGLWASLGPVNLRSTFRSRRCMLALPLVAALGMAACKQEGPQSKLRSDASVQLRGMTLSGESLDLESDFQGKPVLLNLWASWCGPCKLEMPELRTLHRRHKDAGLAIVGINVDSAGQERQAKAVQRRFALPFPSVKDPSSSVSDRLGTRALPTSILLDRNHREIWRHQGLLRADNPGLAKKIQETLAAASNTPAH